MTQNNMKRKLISAITIVFILLVTSFGLVAWKHRIIDPRVDHALWYIIVTMHILAALFILFGIFVLIKNGNHKMISPVLSVLAILVIFVPIFTIDLLIRDPFDYTDYQVIDIPDSETKLVVREESALFATYTLVYTEKNGRADRFLGRYPGGDDGTTPFKDGNYRVTNHQDGTITLHWKVYSSGDQWKELTISLP